MIEQFMTIENLGGILGFSDSRSIKKWCYKNNIQVLRAGKRNYVLSAMVDLHFSKECEKFIGVTNTNKSEIMEAIQSNNRLKLVELVNSSTSMKEKKNLKKSSVHSLQTNNFLENIKSA